MRLLKAAAATRVPSRRLSQYTASPAVQVCAELRQLQASGGLARVVALESTIISHGLPYPRNLETALALEAAVRAEGCVPATVALFGGKLKVGKHGCLAA
ncbi:hypothetical protein HK096_005603, partial [Nowakowskiella sp. JEL0078]